MVKQHNHLYPAFHIREWQKRGGNIYDKRMNGESKIRPIDRYDFSAKYYYSLGEKDDSLENRITTFEKTIAPLISRIESAEGCVPLSKKEVVLLKLYCYLCASRHSNACEVIKEDESGVYQSNHYLFGTFRNETQAEVVSSTEKIVKEFERIAVLPDTTGEEADRQKSSFFSVCTSGLHLSIFRADAPIIIISDRFCILENTMDSDHLYAYVPISPKTALLLVKSEYFYDQTCFERTKKRFGEKYGDGTPDEYLSDLLGAEVDNYENRLFYSAFKDQLMTIRAKKDTDTGFFQIHTLPKEVFRLYNSIYCDDGEKILFCDKAELDFALSHTLQCRTIELGWLH